MKLLYYSSHIITCQSDIERTLCDSGADIELLPACIEQEFSELMPQADIVIIQEKDFERLLLHIVSQAENMPKRRKVAVIKEPQEFTAEAVSMILKQLYTQNMTIHIPTKNGKVVLEANEIIYFEYRERFVYVKTSKDYIKTTLKLKDLPILVSGCPFSSPYVSFVVNFMYVESVRGNSVQLKNGEIIPLSQKKASKYRAEYKHYLSIMS